MGEVKPVEEIFRVIGVLDDGTRMVWRYRSRPDAIYRAKELDTHPDCELVEFSYARVQWLSAPSEWLQ